MSEFRGRPPEPSNNLKSLSEPNDEGEHTEMKSTQDMAVYLQSPYLLRVFVMYLLIYFQSQRKYGSGRI